GQGNSREHFVNRTASAPPGCAIHALVELPEISSFGQPLTVIPAVRRVQTVTPSVFLRSAPMGGQYRSSTPSFGGLALIFSNLKPALCFKTGAPPSPWKRDTPTPSNQANAQGTPSCRCSFSKTTSRGL